MVRHHQAAGGVLPRQFSQPPQAQQRLPVATTQRPGRQRPPCERQQEQRRFGRQRMPDGEDDQLLPVLGRRHGERRAAWRPSPHVAGGRADRGEDLLVRRQRADRVLLRRGGERQTERGRREPVLEVDPQHRELDTRRRVAPDRLQLFGVQPPEGAKLAPRHPGARLRSHRDRGALHVVRSATRRVRARSKQDAGDVVHRESPPPQPPQTSSPPSPPPSQVQDQVAQVQDGEAAGADDEEEEEEEAAAPPAVVERRGRGRGD